MEEEKTAWTGWVFFAATVMVIQGIFHTISGLVALFQNEVFLAGPNNVWIFDLTTWGWAYLLTGVLLLFAGASLFRGGSFGRIIAVLAAIWSMIVNFAFIPIYPLWSILIIALDLVVIYAVIAHGSRSEMEAGL